MMFQLDRLKIAAANYCLTLLILAGVGFQSSFMGLDEGIYPIARLIVMGLLLLMFAVNVSRIRKVDLGKLFAIRLLFFVLIQFGLLLPIALLVDELKKSEIIDVAAAISVIFIFSIIHFSDERIQKLNIAFVIFISLSALSILYGYGFNFEILEHYLPIPKNQLAPLYGLGLMVCFYNFGKSSVRVKLIYGLGILILFTALLFIRGRAALVASFVGFAVIFLFFEKTKWRKIFVILIAPVVAYELWGVFYEAFTANYDASDLNSLSAGRFDNYMAAMKLIGDNIFFGEIFSNESLYKPHNYLIYIWVRYGLLFGFPLMFVYGIIISKIIRGIRKNKNNVKELSLVLMLLLIVVSMFEYTYPYSPGSVTLFAFIMFGQYLGELRRSKHGLTARQFG